MSKNIILCCTVTDVEKGIENIDSKKSKLRVEDYGFKRNDLKIEDMELKVGTITPEMNIPLNEEQIRNIKERAYRRPTAHARELRNNEKAYNDNHHVVNVSQTQNTNGTWRVNNTRVTSFDDMNK